MRAHVSLDDFKFTIWRRLVETLDTMLAGMHAIIQSAIDQRDLA